MLPLFFSGGHRFSRAVRGAKSIWLSPLRTSFPSSYEGPLALGRVAGSRRFLADTSMTSKSSATSLPEMYAGPRQATASCFPLS
jgi:hypothetical protein